MDEIVEEVWKGQIPLRISLDQLSLASKEAPNDYFCMIHRCSYLPALYLALTHYFEKYTIHSSELWLSFNGQPVKWQYPAGVLFDFHCGPAPALPWHLQIHFVRYPKQDLLPYRDEQSAQRLYMNSLKESCGLLIGTSGPVMDMSKADEQKMWESVKNGDWGQFQGFELRVGLEIGRVKYVPIKFLYCRYKGVVQVPVKPLKPDSLEYSVGELARGVFPGFAGYVVAQGIILPDASRIHWLWQALRHPDNFLYLILIDHS